MMSCGDSWWPLLLTHWMLSSGGNQINSEEEEKFVLLHSCMASISAHHDPYVHGSITQAQMRLETEVPDSQRMGPVLQGAT